MKKIFWAAILTMITAAVTGVGLRDVGRPESSSTSQTNLPPQHLQPSKDIRADSLGSVIKEDAFLRLDAVRDRKRSQLTEYVNQLQQCAEKVRSDPVMVQFFRSKRAYYRAYGIAAPPADLRQDMEELKRDICAHYLSNYQSFYDILCVDRNGDVFFTIRKQDDYHKNLFEGELGKTALAANLQKHPKQPYVDYEYYVISDEPSAFMVKPVESAGNPDIIEGWLIMQCAINKINTMFTQEELGATGEAFLVNRDCCMLTDSRFFGDSSILTRHLSRENIEAKFRERQGHKVVNDYRGMQALTSFEVCTILGSEWLLIAKIDEDEVLTEHYRKNREQLRPVLLTALSKSEPVLRNAVPMAGRIRGVDMDEFRKAHGDDVLHTRGVSTCTAAVASDPGRFAYLTHLSVYDRLYGGNGADLLGFMFRQMRTFDVYPYERRRLKYVFAAPHTQSIGAGIDKLVDSGVLLSQIRFLYNGKAEYGNVYHSVCSDETAVEWVVNRQEGITRWQRAADVASVGDTYKKIVRYE